MPRAQRRTWVKLFCYERLHGSVAFQLEPDERSVWDELLCLAGLCGLDGWIADRDQRPFPHSFIAHELHISEELLERTLVKCLEEGRITENEHGLFLVNWKTYQSEYARQKPYRESKHLGLPQNTHIICPECGWQGITTPGATSSCPDCFEKLGKKITCKVLGGEES